MNLIDFASRSGSLSETLWTITQLTVKRTEISSLTVHHVRMFFERKRRIVERGTCIQQYSMIKLRKRKLRHEM